MEKLTFLMMTWNGNRPYPFYNEARIGALAKQLRDHVKIPFRIVVMSEEKLGHIDAVDEIKPCPEELLKGDVNRSPVNCTRRLRLFDPDFAKTVGTEWIAVIDIDTLILDDITDIAEYGISQPFTILRGRGTDREKVKRPYNGAMWFLQVGAERQVWDDWDPIESPKQIEESGWIGSDQVWMCLKIKDAPTIGSEHGVYYLGQYERLMETDADPRVINYAGLCKPWSKMSYRRTPELYEYYCDYDKTAPRYRSSETKATFRV